MKSLEWLEFTEGGKVRTPHGTFEPLLIMLSYASERDPGQIRKNAQEIAEGLGLQRPTLKAKRTS